MYRLSHGATASQSVRANARSSRKTRPELSPLGFATCSKPRKSALKNTPKICLSDPGHTAKMPQILEMAVILDGATTDREHDQVVFRTRDRGHGTFSSCVSSFDL